MEISKRIKKKRKANNQFTQNNSMSNLCEKNIAQCDFFWFCF